MASVSFTAPPRLGQAFVPDVVLPKGKAPNGGYWVHMQVLPDEGGVGQEQWAKVGRELTVNATPSWTGGPATVHLQLVGINDGMHKDVKGADADARLILG